MRRTWMWITLLVVLSLFITQCGSPAAPAAPADQPAAEEGAAGAEAAAGEPVELRMWQHQNPSFIAANEEIIKRFQETHPGVTVKLETFPYGDYLQTLQTSMAAGTEADIMELFGSWVCSYSDRLAELPETVITYNEAQERFYKAPLDGYYCGGKLYGLPNEFNIENGAVLVNPALFEEAGLTFPPEWTSMDDLLADAQKLAVVQDGQMTRSGFHFISGDGLAFQFLAGILQRGGQFWKPDGSGLNFLTPEAKATLEDMKSWVDDYQVTDPFLFNTDQNWVGNSFFQGLVGIGFIGPWIVPEGRRQFPEMDFAYVPLPNYAGDEHLFAADAGWGKTVSPNSQNKELAFEFVKFATDVAENAKTWNIMTGTIPALKEVAADPDVLEQAPWFEASLKVLDYGSYVGPLPDRDKFWYEIVYKHILATLQGSETVDQALEAIDAESNATFTQQ